MDAMGDKIHSKNIAKKSGVSVVPGFVGEVESVEHGLKIGIKFYNFQTIYKINSK